MRQALIPGGLKAENSRMAIRSCVVLALSLLVLTPAVADGLSIEPADMRVEQRGDGGYHLFVRAKPGLGSILLTETTRDPGGKDASYAYRAETWNQVNGDERRMLDGAFIPASSKIYSLIDSSPESDAAFGSAFHVFIPWVVAYGYPWTRNGRVFIADGTFINVRAFALPYADYAGAYRDNPFLVSVAQAPLARDDTDLSAYMQETVDSFGDLASASGGATEYSLGTSDIIPTLARILDGIEGDELDLVICLDTTDSMADDIDAIKEALPPMVTEKTARFRRFRLGLVLYKDYYEEYVVKRFEFTLDPSSFTTAVAQVRVMGGRDIPEAVYEALYESLTGYVWEADARAIVLIGDAPPHPLPRGEVDKDMVAAAAKELAVGISVIILPQ